MAASQKSVSARRYRPRKGTRHGTRRPFHVYFIYQMQPMQSHKDMQTYNIGAKPSILIVVLFILLSYTGGLLCQ